MRQPPPTTPATPTAGPSWPLTSNRDDGDGRGESPWRQPWTSRDERQLSRARPGAGRATNGWQPPAPHKTVHDCSPRGLALMGIAVKSVHVRLHTAGTSVGAPEAPSARSAPPSARRRSRRRPPAQRPQCALRQPRRALLAAARPPGGRWRCAVRARVFACERVRTARRSMATMPRQTPLGRGLCSIVRRMANGATERLREWRSRARGITGNEDISVRQSWRATKEADK